jgi:hypothetical protein
MEGLWIGLSSVIETEQAIRKLDNKMQAPYRIMATKKQTIEGNRPSQQHNSQTTNLHPKKYKHQT